MIAASTGEIIACLFRVPCEVIKQRLQANIYPNLIYGIKQVFKEKSFYRGFGMTIFRDVFYN